MPCADRPWQGGYPILVDASHQTFDRCAGDPQFDVDRHRPAEGQLRSSYELARQGVRRPGRAVPDARPPGGHPGRLARRAMVSSLSIAIIFRGEATCMSRGSSSGRRWSRPSRCPAPRPQRRAAAADHRGRQQPGRRRHLAEPLRGIRPRGRQPVGHQPADEPAGRRDRDDARPVPPGSDRDRPGAQQHPRVHRPVPADEHEGLRHRDPQGHPGRRHRPAARRPSRPPTRTASSTPSSLC